MSLFDSRHKWGEPVRVGARISRTCRVCGRTDTAETLIPDHVLDAIVQDFARPNIYRTLVPR